MSSIQHCGSRGDSYMNLTQCMLGLMSELAGAEVCHCGQKQDTPYGCHLLAREVRQDVELTSNWLPLQALLLTTVGYTNTVKLV